MFPSPASCVPGYQPVVGLRQQGILHLENFLQDWAHRCGHGTAREHLSPGFPPTLLLGRPVLLLEKVVSDGERGDRIFPPAEVCAHDMIIGIFAKLQSCKFGARIRNLVLSFLVCSWVQKYWEHTPRLSSTKQSLKPSCIHGITVKAILSQGDESISLSLFLGEGAVIKDKIKYCLFPPFTCSISWTWTMTKGIISMEDP